jgi:hypothetical protein
MTAAVTSRSTTRRRAPERRLDPNVIDDLVAANRGARRPAQSASLPISCSIAPESVTAKDGEIVVPKDEGKLLYRERFIHGEIYKARPDVNAVVPSRWAQNDIQAPVAANRQPNSGTEIGTRDASPRHYTEAWATPDFTVSASRAAS